MDEKIVYILQDYIDRNCLTEKKFPTKNVDFKWACFYRWAADEILVRCEEELLKPPPHISGRTPKIVTEIINEFADTMEHCYYHASKSNKYMFVVARDSAYDVLDYLEANNYI